MSLRFISALEYLVSASKLLSYLQVLDTEFFIPVRPYPLDAVIIRYEFLKTFECVFVGVFGQYRFVLSETEACTVDLNPLVDDALEMHFYPAFPGIEEGLVFPFRDVEIRSYLAVQST